ncbi:hypothetical protein GE061_004116 [Apolygus lucorum]|uniref:Uncharacterized protein n=1 Tax=Apolygus lucorum TaxID=248454 RepID=A0A8S9X053_APOLU|nr:hypothetical protein GE061_004116 [Apolygus lucorum]
MHQRKHRRQTTATTRSRGESAWRVANRELTTHDYGARHVVRFCEDLEKQPPKETPSAAMTHATATNQTSPTVEAADCDTCSPWIPTQAKRRMEIAPLRTSAFRGEGSVTEGFRPFGSRYAPATLVNVRALVPPVHHLQRCRRPQQGCRCRHQPRHLWLPHHLRMRVIAALPLPNRRPPLQRALDFS